MSDKDVLTRAEQIHLMRTARDRRQARIARWREDPEIQDFLRASHDPAQGGANRMGSGVERSMDRFSETCALLASEQIGDDLSRP